MDFNRLLDDLFQALDPVKRIELRALLHELTATRDIPSVNQAILERAPAVVGADLWRQCCEKQRPRGDPVPAPPDQPAASDAPWRCSWCPQTHGKRPGPNGPKTLCRKCHGRWKNGETGPRSDDWTCDWCPADDSKTRFRYTGPKGPGTLCESCYARHREGATGPPAEDWRCDWCPETSGRRRPGPKGPGTLCGPCGARFKYGKTGPQSPTFECRWCGTTSVRHFDGPTGEDELCVSCGKTYANASDKIKARLVHVEKELERLTSVPVINAETGAETRERPPKRARDDGDAARGGGLEALKAATDATAVDLGRVKRENAALEGQRDRIDATAAEASAAAASANADAATANDDAEEAHDTLGYQVRFTDALQTKIDELYALARQVDPVAADAIKNRQAT